MNVIERNKINLELERKRDEFRKIGYEMCEHCNGRGYFYVGFKAYEDCEKCNGDGELRLNRYKSSDLTNKRSEVLKEARTNGVIIECRNTNGDVVDELVFARRGLYENLYIGKDIAIPVCYDGNNPV